MSFAWREALIVAGFTIFVSSLFFLVIFLLAKIAEAYGMLIMIVIIVSLLVFGLFFASGKMFDEENQ